MSVSSIDGCDSDYSLMELWRKAWFESEDEDEDGVLNESELESVAEQTGLTVDELVNRLDADGDGQISESEVAQMSPGGMPPPPPPPPPPQGGEMGGRFDAALATELLEALEEYNSDNEIDSEEAVIKVDSLLLLTYEKRKLRA